MKHFLQVDFNNQDQEGRIRLNLEVSERDLTQLGDSLKADASVWLTDGEGFVRAVLQCDTIWRAVPDWSSWIDVPWVDVPVTGTSQPLRKAA